MPNNGKSLTNVSFRAKMLEVIDKLKDQDKTALVRHVDDFEALNKDTFEAGMNALVEAIPEGGGGGGGTGDSVYTVTFGLDFQNDGVTCDKTIADIIAHADKHIVGRFVIKDFPMDGVPVTADIYCDNLKFDYQQLKSDDPSVTPIIPTYTYLGFSGDAFILIILDGAPRENSPLEDREIQYYKTCVSIYYLFADENPHWDIAISNLNGGETEINTTDIDISYDDATLSWSSSEHKVVVKNMTSSVDNAYITNGVSDADAKYLLEYFAPRYEPWYHPDTNPPRRRTLLYSYPMAFAHGKQIGMYSKAAQIPLTIDFDTYTIPGHNNITGVFTVAEYIPITYDQNNSLENGLLNLFMDEYDRTNGANKLIRHFVRIYVTGNIPGQREVKVDYQKWEIPYTLINSQ